MSGVLRGPAPSWMACCRTSHEVHELPPLLRVVRSREHAQQLHLQGTGAHRQGSRKGYMGQGLRIMGLHRYRGPGRIKGMARS